MYQVRSGYQDYRNTQEGIGNLAEVQVFRRTHLSNQGSAGRIITLAPADMLLAAMAGSMRAVESMKMGLPQRFGAAHGKLGDFQMDILGAMGELVVSRYLGIPWGGKGELKSVDLGEDIQVRTSERNGPVSLILHDSDNDDHIFYFVRRFEHESRFEVFPPVLAFEAKQKKYWRTDTARPAYFIPSNEIAQLSKTHDA